jgi:hypothetical protein
MTEFKDKLPPNEFTVEVSQELPQEGGRISALLCINPQGNVINFLQITGLTEVFTIEKA